MVKKNKHRPIEKREEILTEICDEDGRPIGVCDGPEDNGLCPWAAENGGIPCTGAWLTSMGWTFKVADDARSICPLAILGITGRRGGYSGRFGS